MISNGKLDRFGIKQAGANQRDSVGGCGRPSSAAILDCESRDDVAVAVKVPGPRGIDSGRGSSVGRQDSSGGALREGQLDELHQPSALSRRLVRARCACRNCTRWVAAYVRFWQATEQKLWPRRVGWNWLPHPAQAVIGLLRESRRVQRHAELTVAEDIHDRPHVGSLGQ
jgi:hypothetical protein